jgi:catechol 2,3-dioxygenase-like lactoylglutathione lyase family enzyme
MERQALSEPATDLKPAEIVRVMCGAHAEVLSAAELSIGRRIAGATRADIQRALWEERTLVKTFGPRGTIHLLPTADLPTWTGALSALPSSVPAHPEPVRFTPAQADEVMAAIGDALRDADLTVDELTEAIAERLGPWAVEQTMAAFQGFWPRWRQLTSTSLIRLKDVRATLALMRTPDGHGRIELDKFHTPNAIRFGPVDAPVNALGIRRIMFAVEDIDAVVARLLAHGAELIGEVVQYEDTNRLAYIRGPEGIIIGLNEQIG